MIEVPLTALFPAISVAITYYICGFNSGAEHYFLCMLCAALTALLALAFGFIFSIVFKTTRLAFELCPLVWIPLFMVAGQASNSGDIIRQYNCSGQRS